MSAGNQVGRPSPQPLPLAEDVSTTAVDRRQESGPAGKPGVTSGRRKARTTASVLWAAWADALGFISELTDESGLKRRLRGRELSEPMTWTRRVGGKFGVQAQLPAGCYSDDTQLRLATSRAISNHGFDVEAFARVELTVWPTYALGGGRASRAAASAMSKSRATWYANFYDGWQASGGNGVAMRIQPHIWAATDLSSLQWLEDVLVNGAVSHGHPRGLVGAVLLGAALAFALREERRPVTKDWSALLAIAEAGTEVMSGRPELNGVWRPAWERATGTSFEQGWHEAVAECRALMDVVEPLVDKGEEEEGADGGLSQATWQELLRALRLLDDDNKGSGTATVVAALALIAATTDPAVAARCAARGVGSDTDTIATMAASVVAAGSEAATSHPQPLQDEHYLRAEAERLAAIASGQPAPAHQYPDLLHWKPPQSQIDAVGYVGEQLALSGFGPLEPFEDPLVNKDVCWQWVRSSFGPTMLVKRRVKMVSMPSFNLPPERQTKPPTSAPAQPDPSTRQQDPVEVTQAGPLGTDPVTAALLDDDDRAPSRPSADMSANRIEVQQMLDWVARQSYADHAVGYAVKRIADIGTVEQLIAFVASLRAHRDSR